MAEKASKEKKEVKEEKASHKAGHAEHKAEHSEHKSEHAVEHKVEHDLEHKTENAKHAETVLEKAVGGKKHSKRTPIEASPAWVEYKPNEIMEVVVTLSNQGQSSSEIGMGLRDQYGIPNIRALTGKSIDDILREHNILPQIPEDLMSLIRKSVRLKSHMDKNKKDFSAKHGYMLTVSKIRRLVKYYHEKKRLAAGWRFSEETAALLVK